jgi:sodium/pantothenate symporter
MIAWVFFLFYAVATAALAWRSRGGAQSSAGFAVGSGTMHPLVAGVTLGACIASSSMFVIMPGFVYAEGLPALIGFSLPLFGGIATGLFVCGPRFQRIGKEVAALTIPHWIGARFRSDFLRRLFSALHVLQIAYLVLITVGCGYVMEAALDVPYPVAVVGTVCFVFAYTGLGGATAHAWTNTLQGVVMLAVALVLFASGMGLWGDVRADLATTGFTAPGSPLFSTHLEVWAVPFLTGFGLATQPHLLSKALYVRGARELRITLLTGTCIFGVFSLVLFVGAYARLILPAGIPQDQVVARYLASAFGFAPLSAAISVAILAAAMSTLDGLLVAIAASVGNDLFPGRGSVWLNRAVLAGLAVATIALALHPPELVLLFGQLGVYGLVAASVGPILAGLFTRSPHAGAASVSAIAGLVLHFGLSTVVGNPGLSASIAMVIAVPIAFVPALIGRPAPVPAHVEGT